MADTRLVLVRTEGPRNAGLALRAAANFGPAEVVFVAPADPGLLGHRELLEMAHGALPGARPVTIAADLEAALAPCARAIGFTARPREHRRTRSFAEFAAGLGEPADGTTALVFGNERHGLSNQEAESLGELVWIPAAPQQPSINLGTCVGIVLCALYQARLAGAGGTALPRRRQAPLAGRDREFLKRHLLDVLPALVEGEAGRRDLAASIERIFSKAALETRDARAWHRLLRALGGGKDPRDYGL